METNANAINWFEIPANDINRAKTFYESIFDIQMESSNMMGMDMAFFPYDPGSGKASGCLCKSQMHTPSQQGVVVYLNGNPDLQKVLGKIEAAGGQVVMPKTKINDDIGHMAFFIDTEGNKVALHSQG
jgi:predicted enzyme related to lactoylglutathione lyase